MSARSLVAFLTLTALLACESPTDPPPQEVQRAGIVQLKARDVLIFAGQQLPLRDLVHQVTDHAGHPVAAYTLSAQLPAGWSIRNDSVIAPAGEAVAQLKVRATYTVPASQSVGALLDLIPDPFADSTARVTAAIDLKARRWAFEFRCSNVGSTGVYVPERGNELVDSLHVVGVVDSVKYAADTGWIPQFGGTAQVWLSGRRVFWGREGSIDTSRYENHQTLMRQAPDTLTFGSPSSSDRQHAVRVTPGTLSQLLRYEGGHWCGDGYRHRRDPVILQEVSP